jgi:hypothetical protein
LSILLGGLTLASLVTTPTLIFGVLSLTALAASYARPEYFIAFLVFAITSCLVTFRIKRDNRLYVALSVIAAIATIFLAEFGLPISGDGKRSFIAFGQYFSINWVEWTKSDLNPWTDWEQIIQTCFGDAHSAIQCALHNPTLVARHVLSNICYLPQWVFELFLFPPQTLTFAGDLRFSRLLSNHFLFIIILGILALGKLRLTTIKTTWPLVSPILFGMGILAMPPLLASSLMYPRDHYLLLLVVLFFAAFLVLIRGCDLQPKRGVVLITLLVGTLFLFQPPVRFETPSMLYVRRAISFLDSLQLHQKVQLLEAEGGFRYYLPENWSRVAQYDKSEPFSAFAIKYDINAIMLTEALERDSRFQSDSQWQDFLSNPINMGFTIVNVPYTPWKLLIRKELLH